MNLSIVVAMSSNGVIGRDGDLPWRLSADLRHFKALTMGKPIVMGRLTHESIGRPLPGRENIVLTRDRHYRADGCTVIHDLDGLYSYCANKDEVMIIGGAQIYAKTLPIASKLYLTEVRADVDGDTRFTGFDRTEWREIERQDFGADEKNDFDFSFVMLVRKRSAGAD